MTDFDFLVDHLQRTRAGLLAAAEAIAPERWRTRPPRGGWSAAEVIAHLRMVEGTILEGAVKTLAREPRPVPLWRRWHIPPKFTEYRLIKVESPIPLDASYLEEKQPMLERLAERRRDTLAFLEAQRGVDLRRWRFPHPFLGSLNAADWFTLMGCHEVRHTKQLREIARDLVGGAA